MLAIRARDAGALHDGFVAEADHAAGKGAGEAAAAADALAAAAAIRRWRLDDAAGAEALYRRALDKIPTHAPATHALVDMLVSGGRGAEAAALLEKTLTWAADVSTMFEVWAREKIVSIYADELNLPDKAAEHQRRLVELTPKDVGRRIRLADIEMCRAGAADLPRRIDNLLALADLAGDPAVAIALKVEAGRTLIAASGAELRRRGEALLGDLVTEDASGLAASGLEGVLSTAAARVELVANELAAAETDAPAEAVRALRFRLAHHYEEDDRFAEAMAALTPLRSEGDPLARAWSYELARRSGEAILEVAILSEEARASDGVLGDEAFVHSRTAKRSPARAIRTARRRRSGRRWRSPAPVRPPSTPRSRWCASRPPTERRAQWRSPTLWPRSRRRAPRTSRWPPARRARPRCCARPPGSRMRATPPRRPTPRRRRACAPTGRSSGCCRPRRSACRAAWAKRCSRWHCWPGMTRQLRSPTPTRPGRRSCSRAPSPGHGSAATTWPRPSPGAPGTPRIRRCSRPRCRISPSWQGPGRRIGPTRGGPARGGTAARSARRSILEVAVDAERRGAGHRAGDLRQRHRRRSGAAGSLDRDPARRARGRRRPRRGAGAGPSGRGGPRSGRGRALLADAAAAYERAGRVDDAITCLAKCVELRPNDSTAYMRAYQLLRTDLDAPGRAMLFDALLSHRLAAAPLTPAARVPVLFERGQHRLQRVVDREAAFADFKEILKISPTSRGAVSTGARRQRGPRPQRRPRTGSAVPWPRPRDARPPRRGWTWPAAYEASEQGHAPWRPCGGRPACGPSIRSRCSGFRIPLDLRAGRVAAGGRGAGGVGAPLPRRRRARGASPAHRFASGAILGRDAQGAAGAFRRAAELDPRWATERARWSRSTTPPDPGGALHTVDRTESWTSGGRSRRIRSTSGGWNVWPSCWTWRATADRRRRSPRADGGRERPRPWRWAGRPPRRRPAAPGRSRRRPRARSGRSWPTRRRGVRRRAVAESHRGGDGAVSGDAGAGQAAADPRGSQRLARIETQRGCARHLGLHLQAAREPGAAVVALEEPGPVLLLDANAENSLAARFQVGRALGILALHATVLERVGPEDLAPLFACAALLAGAAAPGAAATAG